MERFGDYVLLERLGVGSGGTVHLARRVDPDAGDGRLLVVKRLLGELTDRDTFVRRFRHEGLIAVCVESKHVAQVVDVGQVSDTPYIAMEYVEGALLIDVLLKLRKRKIMVPIEILAAIFEGGLRGLQALHDAIHPETGEPLDVVHRDVSPANLILSYEGRLTLIDLGVGKSNVQDWQTEAGIVLGSLGYMAPEQVSGDRLDRRADLYSITAVFYELLALKPYIKRGERRDMLRAMEAPTFEPPSAVRSDVPPELDELVAEGLALSPADRPRSADEMRARLERIVIPALPATVARFLSDLIGDEKKEEQARLRGFLRMPLDATTEEGLDVTVVFARRASSVRTKDDIEAIEPDDSTRRNTALLAPTDPTPPPKLVPSPRPAKQTPAHPPMPVVRIERRRGVPVFVVLVMMLSTVAITIAVDRLIIDTFSAPVRVVARAHPEQVLADVRRLEARATALKQHKPSEAEQLDAILADLKTWSKSTNYARAAAALAQLEKNLDRIDK